MLEIAFDNRRSFSICPSEKEMIFFAANHFCSLAKEAILQRGFFSVALSGGKTPLGIYQALCSPPFKQRIDWQKTYLFFSDERCVPLDHPDSNYHMAMQAGFSKLVPQDRVFPMITTDIEKNALRYEETIQRLLGKELFDLVILGMGQDGHIASLFPSTAALEERKRLVVPNFIPEKKTFRMTLTYPCINNSKHICVYVLGLSKEEAMSKIFVKKQNLPAQKVGTELTKALWIGDAKAFGKVLPSVPK